MGSRAWASSGRKGAPARAARPPGSWPASIARARAAWDGLTAGPTVDIGPDVPEGSLVALGPDDVFSARLGYSDAAAASILSTALGLWSDTAAAMGGEDDSED